MAVISLLHVVRLYRDKTKRSIEKAQEFIKWMYDSLWVSESMLTYIIMWFTEQDNINPPKHPNSEDLEKIISVGDSIWGSKPINIYWGISILPVVNAL